MSEFTFQPYAPSALGLFGHQAQQVGAVCGPMGCTDRYTRAGPRAGLGHLGDWLEALFNAVGVGTQGVSSAVAAGQAAEAQRYAAQASETATAGNVQIALTQAHMAEVAAQSQKEMLQTVLPWAVGGLMVVIAGGILLKK